MELIDRFAPDIEDGRISSHAFFSMINIARNGTLGNATKARDRIIKTFSITSDEETQLDLFISKYLGKTNDGTKAQFLREAEDTLIAYSAGLITKAEVKTNLSL